MSIIAENSIDDNIITAYCLPGQNIIIRDNDAVLQTLKEENKKLKAKIRSLETQLEQNEKLLKLVIPIMVIVLLCLLLVIVLLCLLLAIVLLGFLLF